MPTAVCDHVSRPEPPLNPLLVGSCKLGEWASTTKVRPSPFLHLVVWKPIRVEPSGVDQRKQNSQRSDIDARDDTRSASTRDVVQHNSEEETLNEAFELDDCTDEQTFVQRFKIGSREATDVMRALDLLRGALQPSKTPIESICNVRRLDRQGRQPRRYSKSSVRELT